MWLLFFAILLSTGLAFETVCSFTLHVTDKNTNEILTRKKRELDEEDVINRFEMERVSPLYDIIYDHLPPFDREWTLPGPPAHKPHQGEFQLELRDEEHVVSHSGKRFRENSAAVKWWYSVESFTNLTRLNYTESSRDIDVTNSLQGPSPGPTTTPSVARTQDEDQAVREFSNSRSREGLESSNFTKFGVVEDRIVVGVGDSSRDRPEPRTSISRNQNFEKEVGPPSNVGTDHGFEFALFQNFTQFGVAKDRSVFGGNTVQNIPGSRTPPTRAQKHEKVISRSWNPKTGVVSLYQHNYTQFGAEKDRNIFNRKQDEDHVVSRVPGLRTGRGSPLDAAVIESPATPRVAVTLTPKMEESESKPNYTTRYILLQSGRIVAINVTSAPPVFKPSSVSGGSNKPAAPAVYFGSRLKKNSSRIDKPKNFTLSSEKMVSSKPPIPLKPTVSAIFHRVNMIAKSTPSSVSALRSTPPVLNLANAARDMKLLSTNKPIEKQTPMKSDALLSMPRASMLTFTLPPIPTKSVNLLASTRPPTTTKNLPTERTPVTLKPEQLSTRKMIRTYTTEPTRNILETFPTVRTTSVTKNQYHTLPPRNIVETIFNVLQPDTSEMPFLIVTFDSLKRQFPISNDLAKKQFEDRNREFKLVTSRVEYEDRDHKPKLINYNVNPYPPRTPLDVLIGVAAKPTFPTVTSTNRRAYVSSPPSVTTTQAEVPVEAPESHPRMKHEFVRIVTLPTHVPLTHPQDQTPVRRPKEHRGVSYVTQITKRTPTPPTTETPPQRHAQVPTPSRRPRQQQGFHLRNTVGFQTGPPGAFADRRSIAGTTTTAGSVSKGPRMENMVEALVFRFEPTRRNTRLEALQESTISDTVTTESFTTVRSRIPTKRPTRPVISNAVAPINKPWLIQDTKPRTRSTTTTTLKPAAIATRTGRNSRTRSNPQDALEKEDGGVSSTTAKPFRIYYFEPKRRRTKKLEETTTSAQEKRTSQSPSNIPRRIQTTNPRANPRSNLQRQDQPTVTTSHLVPLQTVPTPTQPVDRGRRGRARFNPATSSIIPTTTLKSSSTVKPTRKHRHSPFIWHRPNVGITKVQTLATDTVPAVSSTVIFPRRRSLVELPPRDSFQDVLFQPVEIERLVTTPQN